MLMKYIILLEREQMPGLLSEHSASNDYFAPKPFSKSPPLPLSPRISFPAEFCFLLYLGLFSRTSDNAEQITCSSIALERK